MEDDDWDGTTETSGDGSGSGSGGSAASAAAASGSLFASAAQKANAAAAKTEKKFALVSTAGTAADGNRMEAVDVSAAATISPQVMADLNVLAEMQQKARAGMSGASFGAVPFAYAPQVSGSGSGSGGANNILGVGATSVTAANGVLLPAHAFKPTGTMHGHATPSDGSSGSGAGGGGAAFDAMQESDNQQLISHDQKRGNKQNVGAATPVSHILAEQGVVQRNKQLKLQQKKNKKDKKKFGGAGDDDGDDMGFGFGGGSGSGSGGAANSMLFSAGFGGAVASNAGSGGSGGGMRTIQQAAASASMNDA